MWAPNLRIVTVTLLALAACAVEPSPEKRALGGASGLPSAHGIPASPATTANTASDAPTTSAPSTTSADASTEAAPDAANHDVASPPSSPTFPPPVTIDDVIADMQQPSEATPSGAPYQAALAYAGPPLPTSAVTTTAAWGMIEHAQGGSPSSNTRVEVRDMKTRVLKASDNAWHTTGHSNLVTDDPGTMTFIGSISACPSPCAAGADPNACDCPNLMAQMFRVEPGNKSVSAKPAPAFYYQPWSFNGVAGTDVKAVLVTYWARLIKDDPNGADDRASARFVANAGVDWYGNSGRLGDGGVGRWKLLTSDWRLVSFLTVAGAYYPNGHDGEVPSVKDVKDNPPPLD